MAELSEFARFTLAGLAVLILFAFAWNATRPMPKLARGLARLCLVQIVVGTTSDHQIFVITNLNNCTSIKHDQAIRFTQRA